MNLLEVGDLPPEFLQSEDVEEAVLVGVGDDIQEDGETQIVYVDNVSDIELLPADGYTRWNTEDVTIEEVSDNQGQIAIQQFVDEEGTVYDSSQFEYSSNGDVTLQRGPFMDRNLTIDNGVITRYVDYDEIEYIDDDILPLENETLIAGEPVVDNVSVVGGDDALAEYDEGVDAEQGPALRRKPPTIVQCDICGVVLKHPSKIEAHMRTHTGEKPYECNICGTKFSQRTPMLNHVRRHMGQTPYECSYGCGKKFVNNALRNAHELRHIGAKRAGPPRPHLKPPKVTVCTRAVMKADQRRQRSEEERSTMVDFAPPLGQIEPPISAAASKRLDEIIESVISGVPIKKRKTRTSRAPLLVQCQICGLMLKHASKIRAHMRTHTGDRPFSCPHCPERFSASGTLRTHIKRKHTEGERPYACTWDCGKRFVSLSTRNEHERVVHAGTKRYECTVTGCFRMFTRRYYLMLHRQREHGLLYKPVFDPEEVVNAEKEADQDLRQGQEQQQTACSYGQMDQILLDPSTNMLVHVSEDGMVLEPEADQHTFMQGEFVEDPEENTLTELMESQLPDINSPNSYIEDDGKLVRYISSDVGLNPEASGMLGVPLLEQQLNEDGDLEEMPCLSSEDSVDCLESVDRSSSKLSFDTGPVNTLKRRFTKRPSILARRH
ncbi:hypothetical protein Q1695_008268 [Nippostrongylus brasiliensis]|nr:hypothetical protein Q1695_008268 [Nippostrongylus brasiliensis]